jgi:soluble lytic murein transglycosylase-like protein
MSQGLRLGLAALGLAGLLLGAALTLSEGLRETLRTTVQDVLLQRRLAVRAGAPDVTAAQRVRTLDPRALSLPQQRVVQWLSQTYRVAPEPVAALVAEAWLVAPPAGLEPTLVLAVMAVESNLHPLVQSGVGALGLMQIMPRIHADKLAPHGGSYAAFEPIINLQVGVQVLQESVGLMRGDLARGLRFYLGGSRMLDSSLGDAYVSKVMRIKNQLDALATAATP